MIDSTGTSTFSYNAAGQTTQLVSPQGTQTYQYNDAGQRISMTEVGFGTTTYTFDEFGRESGTINRFGEASSVRYDSLGRPSIQTNANGTFEVSSYDQSGRLIGRQVRKSSDNTTVSTETYTYNLASQIVSRTKDGVITNYSYDSTGQLTGESRVGYVCTYTYDENGNRSTKTVNGVTEVYAYDDADKLLSAGSKSYFYDSAGRTTTVVTPSGTTSIEYDFESRITNISGPGITATYSYNGLDTRVSKTENGVSNTFARDGIEVTAPIIRDSFSSYTNGVTQRTGNTSTWNHSGLKNAETQSSVSGSITATRIFDAFGNPTSSTGSWSSPFGYGGDFGYQTDVSDLKLVGHRYMDSSTGRFLTRDPDKAGSNWYIYCENDPIIGADPTGLDDQKGGDNGLGDTVRGIGKEIVKDVLKEGLKDIGLGGSWPLVIGTIIAEKIKDDSKPRKEGVPAPIRPGDVVVQHKPITGKKDDHFRIYPGDVLGMSEQELEDLLENGTIGKDVNLIIVFIPPDTYLVTVVLARPRGTGGNIWRY